MGFVNGGAMEKALIYFDNAATVWPKPENVYRFMDEFYRRMASIPDAAATIWRWRRAHFSIVSANA